MRIGKKRDDIKDYIELMEQYDWKLKSKDDENLIFEKEDSKRNYFKTFMKSGLSVNLSTFILIPVWGINLYKYYKLDFHYTISDYWQIFMLYLSIIFIAMTLISLIGRINYLFKNRVDICGEKSEYSISIESVKRKIKNERRDAIILLFLLLIGLIATMVMKSMSKEDIPNANLNLKLTELNDKLEGKIDNELEIRKTIFAEDVYFHQTVYDELKASYYTDRKEYGYLKVDYFSSDYKWVLDKGFESLYNEMNNYADLKANNNGEELKNWGAKKLFVGDNNERIVLYEDSVLSIYGDFDYTKENIDKILKSCRELIK